MYTVRSHRPAPTTYGGSRETLDRAPWQRRTPLTYKTAIAIACAIAIALCIGFVVVITTASDDVNKTVVVTLLGCSAILICVCPLTIYWLMSASLPTSTKTIDSFSDEML